MDRADADKADYLEAFELYLRRNIENQSEVYSQYIQSLTVVRRLACRKGWWKEYIVRRDEMLRFLDSLVFLFDYANIQALYEAVKAREKEEIARLGYNNGADSETTMIFVEASLAEMKMYFKKYYNELRDVLNTEQIYLKAVPSTERSLKYLSTRTYSYEYNNITKQILPAIGYPNHIAVHAAGSPQKRNDVPDVLPGRKTCGQYLAGTDASTFYMHLCDLVHFETRTNKEKTFPQIVVFFEDYLNKWHQNIENAKKRLGDEEAQAEFKGLLQAALEKLASRRIIEELPFKGRQNEPAGNPTLIGEYDENWDIVALKEWPDGETCPAGEEACIWVTEVVQKGYRFTDANQLSFTNKNKIFIPQKVVVRKPYMYRHIPDDTVRALLLDRGADKKEFFAGKASFFSALLSKKDGFWDYLHNELGILVVDGLERQALAEDLTRRCNALGLRTIVNPKDIGIGLSEDGLQQIKSKLNFMWYEHTESEKHDDTDWNERFVITDGGLCYTPPGFDYKDIIASFHIEEHKNIKSLVNQAKKEKPFPEEVAVAYFDLLDRMYSGKADGTFEAYLRDEGEIGLLYRMVRHIEQGREAAKQPCFATYSSMAIEEGWHQKGFAFIVPPFGKGDYIVEDEIKLYDIEPIPTDDRSLANQILDVSVGLEGPNGVIIAPRIRAYTLRSFEDELSELAAIFEGIVNAGHTDKEFKGAKSLVGNFMKNLKAINELDRRLDTEGKRAWLKRNMYIYNLLDKNPGEEFDRIEKAMEKHEGLAGQRQEIEKYRESFCKGWESAVVTLKEDYQIKTIDIKLDEYRVTDNDLDAGWNIRNTEKQYTTDRNQIYVVYGIIKDGIEVDGVQVRGPTLNVYEEKAGD